MFNLFIAFILFGCGNSNSLKSPKNNPKKFIEEYINFKEEDLQLKVSSTKEIFYENQKGDIKKLIEKVEILIEYHKKDLDNLSLLAKNYTKDEFHKISALEENFILALGDEQTLNEYKNSFKDKATRILNKNFFNKINLETDNETLVNKYNEYSYKKLNLFSYLFEKAYEKNDDMLAFTLANLVQGFYNCVTGVVAVTEQSILLLKDYKEYSNSSDFIDDMLNSLKKDILTTMINDNTVIIKTSNNQKADTDNPHTLLFIFTLLKEELKVDVSFEDYINTNFIAERKLILEKFFERYNLKRIKEYLKDYDLEKFRELKGLEKDKALRALLIKEGHLSTENKVM